MKIPEYYKQDDLFAHVGKHKWRCTRLFELAKKLPVMDVPLDHLNIYYKLCTDNPCLRNFVRQMKLVMEADLRYPIILDEDGELMDGAHRICKALYLRRKTIKVVRFDVNPEPDEIDKD